MDLQSYEIKNKSIEECLTFFYKQSEQVKKIVFFEILGVLWADERIEKEEESLIEKMQESLSIDNNMKNEISTWMNTELSNWVKATEAINQKGKDLIGIK